MNSEIVKEFTYNSDSLRMQTAEDGRGVVTVTVAGPLSMKSVLRLLADIEREAIGTINVMLLDLSNAVLMFGQEFAVTLCDRCTGIALLRLPIAVVAPWADAESSLRYQVESAYRGVTRRVFCDVQPACQWVQGYLGRQLPC